MRLLVASVSYTLEFFLDKKRSEIPYPDQKSLFNAFRYWQGQGARKLRCYKFTIHDITQDVEEVANYDRR